jgi:hypothetical protein
VAGELKPEVVYTGGEWADGGNDLLRYNWTVDPLFEFTTEVQALMALEFMAEDYRAALKQAKQIMRYMKAAIAAARALPEGERPHPQAIIGHTRLARQTVYNILDGISHGDAEDPEAGS